MKKTFLLMWLFVLLCLNTGHSQELSSLAVPTPYIQGVNVITGQADDSHSSSIFYNYYQSGWNSIEQEKIFLKKEDFRIGKVKTIENRTADSAQIIYLTYEQGVTFVHEAAERVNAYHYTDAYLINKVEHYQKKAEEALQLYRAERLFWQDDQVISRVLENDKGQALLCYCFVYNDKNQVIKETLIGNLSGNSSFPLQIGKEGYPEMSEIESYSKNFIYADDQDLILKQIEDNGLITTYQYNDLQQCIAKLIGNDQKFFSRCFYVYDSEGFLEQTIVDDGQNLKVDDLTGVTQRQIVRSTLSKQEPILGQPLKIENLYWDPIEQVECTLEKKLYFYSDRGQVIRQEFYDAEGALRYDVRFNYNAEGEIESTVDSRGEVAFREESTSSTLQQRYDQEGCRLATIDAYGNETNYQYDALGRLISTQYPAVRDADDNVYRPQVQQTYNICDQVVEVTDASGEKLSVQYNIRGKPTEINYPDGSKENFVYFLNGALKQKKQRDGITLAYARDVLSRVIRSEKYARSGILLETLSYTYQAEQVLTVTDEKNFTTNFLYDSLGRQIGSIHETADGKKRLEWDYDLNGNKSQIREWFGNGKKDFVTKYEQKDENQNLQLTSFKDEGGEVQYKLPASTSSFQNILSKQEAVTLNPLGQHVKQEEVTDINGIRQVIQYDALLRIEQITKYNSSGIKLSGTHFRYDAQGNKTLERHDIIVDKHQTKTFTLRWKYDACNHLLEIQEGDSTQNKITRYQYDQYGQLKQVIKPDGVALYYSYADNGKLEHFEASDHSFAYYYGYDDFQRLIKIEDLKASIIQTRQYNAFHELIEDHQNAGVTLKHQYDLAGRATELILPDESGVNYQYQGPFLTSINRKDAEGSSLYRHQDDYHAQGYLQASQLINEIGRINYRYDDHHRLIEVQSPWFSQTAEKIDAQGRFLSLDEQGQKISYTYTDEGQLASEKEYAYAYDSLFNRLSENGESFEVNDLNQLTKDSSATYEYDLNGNLIKKSSATYEYDLNGNLIKKSSADKEIFYTYDALDRLTRIEYPREIALAYQYDAFDRRLTQKTWEWSEIEKDWSPDSTYQFIYDELNEIGKINDQGEIIELRILKQNQKVETGRAIAIELENKLFVPLHDLKGSIRCLVDVETKEIAESYQYSAYGKEKISDENCLVISSSKIGNPWRYASKRTDDHSNFVFFGRRYYDASMGRWLTPDPLFFYDTPNVYAFVKNDPVNHQDAHGLFSISQIWENTVNTLCYFFRYMQISAHKAKISWGTELKIPSSYGKALDKAGMFFFGNMYFLLGSHFEETQVDCYGEREISDKVRITFINGILNTRSMMLETLELISETHGGAKVHYVYRPTEGWTWDVTRAAMIRTCFTLGFRSMHAHLLAKLWKGLIQDMGGADQGGTIVHYAHSLGGAETDRARGLLSEEEQRMIRVITFGSATLVRNVGFQSVTNIVSVNDGVSMILEPLGQIRNLLDSDSNVNYHSSYHPYWHWGIADHSINGTTYAPVMAHFGQKFLAEFNPS